MIWENASPTSCGNQEAKQDHCWSVHVMTKSKATWDWLSGCNQHYLLSAMCPWTRHSLLLGLALYILFFLDGYNIFLSCFFLFLLFTASVTFYLTQHVQNTMISTFYQLYKVTNEIIFYSIYICFQNTKCLAFLFVITAFRTPRQEDRYKLKASLSCRATSRSAKLPNYLCFFKLKKCLSQLKC